MFSRIICCEQMQLEICTSGTVQESKQEKQTEPEVRLGPSGGGEKSAKFFSATTANYYVSVTVNWLPGCHPK